MDAEQAEIQERLEEILSMIPCPDAVCWGLHGCHYEYYYDESCECHVLEVWPIGFEEPEEDGGNGHEKTGQEICYEFAEFEFGKMVKEIPVEHLHFSQRRQIFEIGWKEKERDMELRVHIEPVEVNRE